MNKVILIGNLTRDPETRTTTSGITCCAFSIAVNRRRTNADGNHEVDYFNVTAWRQLGELCMKYLSKGRKVCVEGSIQIRTYDAQDGSKRTAVDVIADSVEFLSPQNAGGTPATSAAPTHASAAYGHRRMSDMPGSSGSGAVAPPAFSAANGFTEVNDDELPF